jgi:hypothetical protein
VKLAEYSANFDTDTLETLLQRVSAGWPAIITPQRVRDFIAFVRSLAHDDEKPFSFTAEHAGEEQEITFTVFMDDIDSPDVSFYAFPALIESITSEHTKLCEELGI